MQGVPVPPTSPAVRQSRVSRRRRPAGPPVLILSKSSFRGCESRVDHGDVIVIDDRVVP
jgi:hypothetical protein